MVRWTGLLLAHLAARLDRFISGEASAGEREVTRRKSRSMATTVEGAYSF
jgi:hypothetical protein